MMDDRDQLLSLLSRASWALLRLSGERPGKKVDRLGGENLLREITAVLKAAGKLP